jgi:hypothetical protein
MTMLDDGLPAWNPPAPLLGTGLEEGDGTTGPTPGTVTSPVEPEPGLGPEPEPSPFPEDPEPEPEPAPGIAAVAVGAGMVRVMVLPVGPQWLQKVTVVVYPSGTEGAVGCDTTSVVVVAAGLVRVTVVGVAAH